MTLREKWIAALRSGSYKQGRGALRIDGKYCCLGVLCDVAGMAIARDGQALNSGFCNQGGLSLCWTVPPDSVLDKVGIQEEVDFLVILNDKDKLSFDDIADYLEDEE